MTDNERVELELYIDIINSLIAKLYQFASSHNVSLESDDDVGLYYKRMLKYVHHLRMSTSYDDVLTAKKNIPAIKEKLAKLEAEYAI